MPGCHGLPGEACRENAEKLSGPVVPSPLASLPHVLVSRLRTHLVKFSKDGTELGMQDCQLEGQVTAALVTTGCCIYIHHGHLVQEALHGRSMILQEAIHKAHVGFLLTKPGLGSNWVGQVRFCYPLGQTIPLSPPSLPAPTELGWQGSG